MVAKESKMGDRMLESGGTVTLAESLVIEEEVLE
jgi:hypothetical protein